MIIPCEYHDDRVPLVNKFSLRLVTCQLGTYCEVYSESMGRPMINGKLFLIDVEGRLVRFKDVNKKFVDRDDATKVISIT